VNSNDHQLQSEPFGLSFKYKEGIQAIRLIVKPKTGGKRFRFYGLSVENEENSGVVYHSTGVGAAAFRSVLLLDKMPDQASVLKPDMVILDFGTNDILSTNKIDVNLEKQVLKSINKFRAVNPDIIIILTTTQDLFYKGKPVTACFAFRDLMDSIARKQNCLFWNWFDLAGGTKTIKIWNAEGYAQNDCIHLTKKGYQVKGQLLYESFENTLCLYRDQATITDYTIPGKLYKDYVPAVVIPNPTNTVVVDSSSTVSDSIAPKVIKVKPPKVVPKPVLKKYIVKKGDTLSQIAERNRTSVSKIMKANRLRSDRLSIGQVLVIPK
jgi:LysM repeat protein/lysophospholipase L1-like esterase